MRVVAEIGVTNEKAGSVPPIRSLRKLPAVVVPIGTSEPAQSPRMLV